MAVFRLNDVKPETVGRSTTTMDEIDWLYGKPKQWGMPDGRLSMVSAAAGTGKTRLICQWMKGWDALGWSSMICQGEVSPAQFAFEKMEGYKSDKIIITDDMGIYQQIDHIKTYAPKFMITDSVQQIEEYKGGRGAKEIVRELRKVISQTGTHVIFISQLTSDGKSKGGTELPHEVDAEIFMSRWAPETCPDILKFEMNKNRYGKGLQHAILCHTDEGIVCQSEHRFADPKWVAEHPNSRRSVVAAPSVGKQGKQRGAVGRFFWGNT